MNFARLLDGKLLLRSELPLASATIHYLKRTHQLLPHPSITISFHNKQCQRCLNKRTHQFAKIRCYRCLQSHFYCRHCLQTGRNLGCEPLWRWHANKITWSVQKNPCYWQGQLTSLQQEVSTRVVNAIHLKQKELMVWAVCGAGKTEMLFAAVTKAIQTGKRICLTTPRTDVVRELYPRFCHAFPQTEIEALYAGSEYRLDTGQLIICTTHQLIRFHSAFDLMIIDEIDAFPFSHVPNLKELAIRACRKEATRIYLSATPNKKQQRQIRRQQLPVAFVPLRYHGYPLPVPQLQLEWKHRDQLLKYNRSRLLDVFLEQRFTERQLLIFVPTVALAESIAKHYQTMFVHAEDVDRQEKINQFRARQFDILITTTILERGVTFPAIDVIVLDAGHQVFGESALVQIAGRAGRSPTDPKGKVLFIHQGRTEAMQAAVQQINMMNRKGRLLCHTV